MKEEMVNSRERKKKKTKKQKTQKAEPRIIFEDQRRLLMHTLSTCARLYFRISMGRDDCSVCLALIFHERDSQLWLS